MKRLLLFIILMLLLTTEAHAAGAADALSGALPEGLSEAAEQGGVLRGGIEWLKTSLGGNLPGTLQSGVRSAVLLTLCALVCGELDTLAASAGGPAQRYVTLCGVLAASAVATGDVRSLIGLGMETVNALGELARLLMPAVAGAIAAGGLVSTASVWQVTTLMVCDALCTAASRLLLPLACCCIASAAAGAALEEGSLERLSDGIFGLSSVALKLALAAFSGYIAAAGVLSGSTDRAAIKAAKIAASGAVPVVGGILSDAAESVLAAAGTLRGTAGALGVFAVLAACLAPLVKIGAHYLLYRLAALASSLVGTKTLGDFLERLGGAFALVFAATASCALVLLAALLVAVTMTAL